MRSCSTYDACLKKEEVTRLLMMMLHPHLTQLEQESNTRRLEDSTLEFKGATITQKDGSETRIPIGYTAEKPSKVDRYSQPDDLLSCD